MKLSRNLAEKTLNRYVCARCWGRLIGKHIPGDAGHIDVVCAKSPDCCDGNGFVTAAYAEKARAQSWQDLWDVRWNYPHIEPALLISSEMAMSDLGF